MSVVFGKKTRPSFEMIFFLFVLHLCSFALATYSFSFGGSSLASRTIPFWNEFQRRKSVFSSFNSRPVRPRQEYRTILKIRESNYNNLPPKFNFPILSDFSRKWNEGFSKDTTGLPIYNAGDFNKYFSNTSWYQINNNQWWSPAVGYATFYNPTKPYQLPAKLIEEYGLPTVPFGIFQLPLNPAGVYGAPTKPAVIFGPPKPFDTYGPPVKPAAAYDLSKIFELPIKAAQAWASPRKPAQTYGPPRKNCKNKETLNPIDVRRVDFKTDFSLPVRPNVDFNKNALWFAPRKDNWLASSWNSPPFDLPSNFKDNNYLTNFPINFRP